MEYEVVSREDFLNKVGPMDVCVSIIGDYPYTSVFKTRQGVEVGRIKPKSTHPQISEYRLIKRG